MSKELVKQSDAITPEILGPGDRDPFTSSCPISAVYQAQAIRNADQAWDELKLTAVQTAEEIAAARRERFQEAYGYRFDRHGRLRFP